MPDFLVLQKLLNTPLTSAIVQNGADQVGGSNRPTNLKGVENQLAPTSS